jgi:hypothetical protein
MSAMNKATIIAEFEIWLPPGFLAELETISAYDGN